MSEKEYLRSLEDRVSKLEETVHNGEIDHLKNYRQLEQLVYSAVKEGNREILSLIDDHNLRICKLEKQDGEKAKAIIKAIVATSLSWLVMGILTNLPTIIK